MDPATVYLVEQHPDAPAEVHSHLAAAGFDVVSSPAADPQRVGSRTRPGCVVLASNGNPDAETELLRTLCDDPCDIPTVVVAAHARIDRAVECIKTGAVDYLEQPVAGEALVRAVREAVDLDQARLTHRRARECCRELYETLTPREREVMELLVSGRSVKETAHELGISVKTAHTHRARMLLKMHVDNVLELARAMDVMRRREPSTAATA